MYLIKIIINMSFFDFKEEIIVNICICILERVLKINIFLLNLGCYL